MIRLAISAPYVAITCKRTSKPAVAVTESMKMWSCNAGDTRTRRTDDIVWSFGLKDKKPREIIVENRLTHI
jgi:hypothetical protein